MEQKKKTAETTMSLHAVVPIAYDMKIGALICLFCCCYYFACQIDSVNQLYNLYWSQQKETKTNLIELVKIAPLFDHKNDHFGCPMVKGSFKRCDDDDDIDSFRMFFWEKKQHKIKSKQNELIAMLFFLAWKYIHWADCVLTA